MGDDNALPYPALVLAKQTLLVVVATILCRSHCGDSEHQTYRISISSVIRQ
jgi:hypothetical protein